MEWNVFLGMLYTSMLRDSGLGKKGTWRGGGSGGEWTGPGQAWKGCGRGYGMVVFCDEDVVMDVGRWDHVVGHWNWTSRS